jgi:uncharacterized protein with GYD domain
MKRRIAAAVTSLTLLVVGLGVISGDAVGQQASADHHRYLIRAAFTVDGMKNLQKQSATGFKAGVVKFFESVGGKLESWYFDYGDSAAYGFVDYPDEIAAAAAQASVSSKKQRHTARSEPTFARGRGPTAIDAQQKD